MAKARLGTMTKKWIDGKEEKPNEKQHDVKSGSHKKTKLTIYISKDTVKALWHNRADTGEPISHTIEKLVIESIGKKTKK